MLTEDKLTEAIQEADKTAARCGRLCRYGAEIVDGKYHIYHNGTGPASTSDQLVYESAALGLAQPALTARLKDWLGALHHYEPKPYDLNKGA